MKVLVCIKDVADEPAAMGSLEKGYPRYADSMARRMDRLSEYALEMALSLKDVDPAVVVDTVSAAPPCGEGTLKRSLEMGADRAFRIDVKEEDTWHPETVSALLEDFTRGWDYDLILTGAMSEDLMQGVTGPLLGAAMKLPVVPAVMEGAFEKEDGDLVTFSELEGGSRVEGRITLPALVTVQSGPVNPRYPTLTSKLRARQQEVNLLPGLSREGAVTTGEYTFEKPDSLDLVSMLEGSAEEKAGKLLEILAGTGVLP